MLLRSFWNGALACRSWIAFFHSSVVETSMSRRRSFKKYKMMSAGTAMAAAIPARMGVAKVIGLPGGRRTGRRQVHRSHRGDMEGTEKNTH